MEAILKHEKQKNGKAVKYLLKWGDQSKGETWETYEKASMCCPNLLKAYIEKVVEEVTAANAVSYFHFTFGYNGIVKECLH